MQEPTASRRGGAILPGGLVLPAVNAPIRASEQTLSRLGAVHAESSNAIQTKYLEQEAPQATPDYSANGTTIAIQAVVRVGNDLA